MSQDSGQVPANSFDRFKEYEIVNSAYAAIQSRRQTSTSLFLSLNLAFIGAIGFLILFSHLNSWWAVGAVCALALAVWPMNLTWHRTLERYQHVVFYYLGYLEKIELEFQRSQADTRVGLPEIGLYRQQGTFTPGHSSVVQLERRLALYFLFLYPAIAAAVAILTYLVIGQILPVPTFGGTGHSCVCSGNTKPQFDFCVEARIIVQGRINVHRELSTRW